MHFTVLVVGGNHDGQLYPFWEDLRTTFNDQTESFKKEYETETLEIIELADGRRISKHCKESEPFWNRKYEGIISSEDTLELPSDAHLKVVKFCDFYPDLKTFASEWHGIKPTGRKYGYWYNPQAKWDGWCVGGRWKDHLLLKNGTKADEAIWGDVDVEKLEATFAILMDGAWHEQDEWNLGEHEQEEWETEFKEIVKNIDPDTPVAVIDCHI